VLNTLYLLSFPGCSGNMNQHSGKMHIHINIYTYIHINIYTYMYIHIYACTHVYVSYVLYVYICIYIYMNIMGCPHEAMRYFLECNPKS